MKDRKPMVERVAYSNLQVRFLRHLWNHEIPIRDLGSRNMIRLRGLALRDPSPIQVSGGNLMLSQHGVEVVSSFSGSDSAQRIKAGDITESVQNALALVRTRKRKS